METYALGKRRLRTAAAAAHCGLTKSTFEKLRLTGGGPAYIKVGKIVVYDELDLDRWLSCRRRTSTSDKGASDPGSPTSPIAA